VDWIFDHLQIVVLVVLGIGSMVKSMFDAKSKQAAEREADRNPTPEVPLDDDTSYRKSLRKTLPTVPPPLTRPATPPPLRMAGYDAEAANEAAKVLKHQHDLAERMRQIRANKATTTGGASATRARIASKGVAMPLKQTPLTLRRRLRDSGEVRQAFVMREILDPPVGLR
jgi:hypothetical protein